MKGSIMISLVLSGILACAVGFRIGHERDFSISSAAGKCPSTSGPNPVYLPDSKDCSIFYECDKVGTPIPMKCPPDLEFSPTLHVCTFPKDSGCQATKNRVNSMFSPVGQCPSTSDQYSVYLPDSKNCSIFYECDKIGTPIQLSCPPDLEFSPTLHVCTFPKNSGCQASEKRSLVVFSPVGQCPTHQGQYPVYLPDSNNCSIFYECDAYGNPLVVECPPDLEFNPVSHVCDFPDSAGCKAHQ